ncbi:putative polysaccharide deacetylase [Haloferax mucosum ATCC BAA-1512]|uniref:Putative polysaccharide deacetylase n=1 Tax=Haloferax mucosum ATCC BAA-1512 TaxID=662479 RepID=M0IPT7_9EURY|nr:polysaccharide deacetylase family protein [Haloferax mucosum]ELZ98022.1 putative polysaccharide deacetylase [Haloferax mucosum ATCC BAA-1512]
MSLTTHRATTNGHAYTPATNALSFDLEHWYSATLVADAVSNPDDHIEQSVDLVLDLLADHGVSATFFVVGEVAIEYPDLVRRLVREGHEVGSHGHTHTPLFELTPEAFERELSESADAIRSAAGVEPLGFRAPNFSVTRETAWAFDVLEASQYRYDSSVFPVRTPMYGVSDAPTTPYLVTSPTRPFEASAGNCTAGGTDRLASGVAEFPISVVETPLESLSSRGIPTRIPFAGGFYARALPTWLLRRLVRRQNARGCPVNLYFHPWEFNERVRVAGLPAHKRFVSYYGLDTTARKLDRLLSEFDFGTVRSALASGLDGTGTDTTSNATDRLRRHTDHERHDYRL